MTSIAEENLAYKIRAIYFGQIACLFFCVSLIMHNYPIVYPITISFNGLTNVNNYLITQFQ